MTEPGEETPGRGASNTRRSQPKTAVFAPIPRARVATATSVNPGLLRSIRSAYRRSVQMLNTVASLSAFLRFRRERFFHYPAVADVDRPFRVLSQARIVRHRTNRGSRPMQLGQQ